MYKELKEIAYTSLKSCMSDIGYTAGVHHFVDLWARDSLFACLGDISSKDTLITLQTFSNYQREDGLIPYRIRRSRVTLKKYFGKPEMLKSPVADFRSFQSGHTVYDGGATYILIQSEYVLSTGDINVLKDSLNTVMKSIEFYRKRFNDGLIKEGYLCEWADAVLKKGYVLYTNIVYLSGIKRFIEILKKYRGVVDVDVINDYEKYYEKLKIQLYTNLWNGKYFSDYNDGKRRDYLAVHPNMLAILFDITTKEENMSIIKEVEKNCLLDLGMRSNYPKYPIHLIPIHNYLAGVPDYHNGIYWLQPWVLYISVLLKLKRREDAIIQLNRLNEIIIRDNCVYENYDYDFKPTNRLFYKSEGPFAWNSGLILWMLKQLNGI